jgi:hypothetical protein
METLKIHTKDKEQLKTVKTILKALKVPFEASEESPYDPEFVAELKESEKQMKEGKKSRVRGKEELKKFLEIE